MTNLAVIGAGGRGAIAKLAHRPADGFQLSVACDTNPSVLDAYRAEFGPSLSVTPDWRDAIARADVSAVFITAPDFLHEEMAVTALDAGKAVYLEKPMAITLEGCDRILAAAARRSAPLYVGHNMRFFPVMQKIKALVDAGAIGQLQAIWCRHFIDYGGDAYFKDWHSERRLTTGLLLQKAAHDLDMIHWFAGAYTRRTVAMGKLSVYNQAPDRRPAGSPGIATWSNDNWPPLSQKGLSPVIDVEDHSMMLMQLDNGTQASYEQCHYTPDGHRNYTLIGTHGRIENHGDHSTDARTAHVRLWTRRCGSAIDDFQTIAVPPVEGAHGGADPLIVADFLRFLRTGQRQGADPLAARMAVAAGYLATQSLRNNNIPYDVPPPSISP